MGIHAKHLNYTYRRGTASAQPTPRGVNFDISDGQLVRLIGHTGSGKSALIQHLNGLIRATEDKLFVDDRNIYGKGYNIHTLHTKVGLVSQCPEHQLFEIDVFQDVCFGPKNMGLSKDEIERRTREALGMVGLPGGSYREPPFELSGGQKHRVAIAGVLTMRPKVPMLDEPTAGLDPHGRDEILDRMKELNHSWGLTVILMPHSMGDVAKYADRLLVMSDGEKRFGGTPKEVPRHYAELEALDFSAPQATYLVQKLRKAGMLLSDEITTVAEARDALLPLLKGGAPC